jgi:hypothetical protein
MTTLNVFLSGAICMACLVIALHFLQLWRRTRDRLFVFFLAAFVALAAERVVQLGVSAENEYGPYIYVARLVAFGLIAAGVIDKNRAR